MFHDTKNWMRSLFNYYFDDCSMLNVVVMFLSFRVTYRILAKGWLSLVEIDDLKSKSWYLHSQLINHKIVNGVSRPGKGFPSPLLSFHGIYFIIFNYLRLFVLKWFISFDWYEMLRALIWGCDAVVRKCILFAVDWLLDHRVPNWGEGSKYWAWFVRRSRIKSRISIVEFSYPWYSRPESWVGVYWVENVLRKERKKEIEKFQPKKSTEWVVMRRRTYSMTP